MNDYLSNLAARSFDFSEGIPLVIPRLPSLFEPLEAARDVFAPVESWPSTDNESGEGRRLELLHKTGEWSGQGEQVQQTPYDSSGTSDTRADNGTPLHEHPAPGTAERDLGANEQAVAAPFSKRQNNTPTFRMSEKSSVSSVPEMALRPEMREEPAVRGQVKDEPQMTDRPDKKDKLVPVREDHEEWSARRMIRARQHQIAGLTPLSTDQGKRSANPDVPKEAVARKQETVISPLTAHPSLRPIEPMLRPRHNPGPHGDAAQSGSTIQVTIGRIEVRAAPPAAQTRPKPKGPAPMSLDEYLRGRNGGGR